MHLLRRILCLGVTAFALQACVPPAAAQPAVSTPKLVVTPHLGRPNDIFYLAGGGFPTGSHPHRLSVTMYCPDVYPDLYGRWTYHVTVGKDGTFVAETAQVPTPQFVKSTWCRLRARNGDDPLGVAADFYILSQDDPEPANIYDMTVTARMAADGGTVNQTFHVAFLPGAQMRYKVSFPGNKPLRYRSQIPWTGQQTLHWPAPLHLPRPARVRIDVSGHLGTLQGKTTVWTQLR